MSPYNEVDKPLHDKPSIVRVPGDNNCYFHSVVYFLTELQDQHSAVIQSLCDYIVDEKKWHCAVAHLRDMQQMSYI